MAARSTRRGKKTLTIGIIGLGNATEENINQLLGDHTDGAEATFVIPVTKEHCTDAVQVVLDYIEESDASFTAIVDDTTAKSRTLKGIAKSADAEIKATDVGIAVVNAIKDKENPRLLVLVDPDVGEDEDDGGTYDAIEEALDNEIPCFDLAAGLKPIAFTGDDDDEQAEGEAEDAEPEPEPEPEEKPRARRARAKAEVVTEPEPDDEPEEEAQDGAAARAGLPPYKEAVKLGVRKLRSMARERELASHRTIGSMSEDQVLDLLYPDGDVTVVPAASLEQQVAAAQHAVTNGGGISNGGQMISIATLVEMISVSVAERVKELVDA